MSGSRLKTRTVRDALGEIEIPVEASYGIETARAARNFPISGKHVHRELPRSYIRLKKAAARANVSVGVLDALRGEAIAHAAAFLLNDLGNDFIVDAYQAGAGTSEHMNVNEVLAHHANAWIQKHQPPEMAVRVDPHDHVNQSQSTNDTYPTALRLALLSLSRGLIAELEALSRSFEERARAFAPIIKAGRTHLRDAVPIHLGDEFGAYAVTTHRLAVTVQAARPALHELGLGGSAAGSGLNVPPGFAEAALQELRQICDEPNLRLAPNRFEAMQSQLPVLMYSSALRAAALELTRISNDLRLLNSGPGTGLGEIEFPEVQAGSSIMGGKVNPSHLEMLHQVLFKVIGNDTALAYAMQAGQLELNVMMPLMAQTTLESTEILTCALHVVRTRCIDKIQANQQRTRAWAQRSNALATILNPLIGYEKSAAIAREALRTGRSIREIAEEQGVSAEHLRLLDPERMA